MEGIKKRFTRKELRDLHFILVLINEDNKEYPTESFTRFTTLHQLLKTLAQSCLIEFHRSIKRFCYKKRSKKKPDELLKMLYDIEETLIQSRPTKLQHIFLLIGGQ